MNKAHSFPHNPPTDNHKSQTDFGKLTGYTRDQVKHMKRQNRLVMEGRWVLIAESLERISETESKRSITASAVPDWGDEDSEDAQEGQTNFQRMFLEARARKEHALAIKAELENRAKRGELVSMAIVEKMMASRSRAFRDGLTSSAKRLAPVVAGMQDVRKIEAELDTEFRYLLEQWAKEPII